MIARGADPKGTRPNGQTLLEEWLTTGYSAHEVEPEVIVGIAEAFVEIGARNEVGLSDSRRPSERAENWGTHKGMRHYAAAGRILRGARGGDG